jgi:hypothetical protein
MSFSHPHPPLWARAAGHGSHQQPPGQGMEFKAPIETVGGRAQVTLGVLAEGKGVVGPAKVGIDIPKDGAHPVKERQLLGFAPANDSTQMHTADLGHAGETDQAIGDAPAVRPQLSAGPVGNRQEPGRQSQLGTLKQGAGDQRGLAMADIALEGLAGSDPQHAVARATTARAAKTHRPARALQRCFALRLGPVLPENSNSDILGCNCMRFIAMAPCKTTAPHAR